MNENKIQAYFKEPVKFRGNRQKIDINKYQIIPLTS